MYFFTIVEDFKVLINQKNIVAVEEGTAIEIIDKAKFEAN